MSGKVKTEDIIDLLTVLVDSKDIVLYNDDHNTFQHVIDVLEKYCDHTSLQAEQCAWIVHYNGKCSHDCFILFKIVYTKLR